MTTHAFVRHIRTALRSNYTMPDRMASEANHLGCLIYDWTAGLDIEHPSPDEAAANEFLHQIAEELINE